MQSFTLASLVAAELMGGVAVAERDRILPETSGNKTASCVQGENNYCGRLQQRDTKDMESCVGCSDAGI